jgi:hypothetical protein
MAALPAGPPLSSANPPIPACPAPPRPARRAPTRLASPRLGGPARLAWASRPARLYGVNVPAMSFQLHEWDIHAI